MSSTISAASSCRLDSDCLNPNEHCVYGQCQVLVSSGHFCRVGRDCASFIYYGEDACSEDCGDEAMCSLRFNPVIQNTSKCCKPIPLGGICYPSSEKPTWLSGCSRGSKCLPSKNEGVFVCSVKESPYWGVGLALGIIGSNLSKVGINIERKALKHHPAHYMKSKSWIIATLLILFGKIIFFTAYLFAAQSLLVPIGSLALVGNLVFANWINKEEITWKEGIGTLLIVLGSFLIVANGTKSEQSFSVCMIQRLSAKIPNIIWTSLLGCITVMLIAYIFYFQHKILKENPSRSGELRHSVAYFSVTAIFGFFVSFLAKLLAELINKTVIFKAENQFKYILPYFILLGLILSIVIYLYYLGETLERFEAMLAVPMIMVISMVISNISAGVYFQEFRAFSTQNYILFFSGFGFIICGVSFFALRVFSKLATSKSPV